jgi:HSP20 family protein
VTELSSSKETSKPKSEKKDIVVSQKQAPAPSKSRKKQTELATTSSTDLLQSFDEVFDRFREDFRDLLLPSSQAIEDLWNLIPETRMAVVDLEDRGKDFLLKAEMPGFKKEDVDIQVYDDAVEISGSVGWKYDGKKQDYICHERACESFYRMVDLPEEIKSDDVQAELKDGVLEMVLPKKAPRQAKKVSLK